MTMSSVATERWKDGNGTKQFQGRRASTLPATSGGASTLRNPSTHLRFKSSLNSAPIFSQRETIFCSERSNFDLSALINTMDHSPGPDQLAETIDIGTGLWPFAIAP